MKVILTTPEELKEIVNRTLKEALNDILPKVIRQASKKEWLSTDGLPSVQQAACSIPQGQRSTIVFTKWPDNPLSY